MFNDIRQSGGTFRLSVVLAAVWGLVYGKEAWAGSNSFSESQKDAVMCDSSGFCDQFTKGKFTLKATAFTHGELDEVTFDTNTVVAISIGNWSFNGTLAQATFTDTSVQEIIPLAHDKNGTIVIHGKVTLKGVHGKGLNVNISATTGATADEDFETSVIADNHASDNGPFTDTITAEIVIGDSTNSTVFAISGTAKTKPVTKSGDEFDLNAVKLKGTPAN
jgi:hypothetical protein